MNPLKFEQAIYKKQIESGEILFPEKYEIKRNISPLKFEMPKSFWFKVLNDRCEIHWAVIKNENQKYNIYFINVFGQVFDIIELSNVRIAKRLLRKNKFISSNNRKVPYMPIQPCFLYPEKGKKSAPYSKGNLWIRQERYGS